MDKKALKREYKESRAPMGVYRVHNTIADRSLVGSSVNLPAILNRHRAELRMGMHKNRALQQDWTQLGEDAFAFEILDTVTPRDEPGFDGAGEVRALEQLWLERFEPYGERVYNPPPK
jgi:hypothetical protein